MFRGILAAAGGVLALLLIVSLISGGSLMYFKFWAPQWRDAQREVFTESQSYVQGKISHITRLRLSYEGAEGDQREALRRTILIEAATVDSEDLPEELQTFITSLSPPEGEDQP